MNKGAIKNFATWARDELIEKVTHRAVEYKVFKDEKNEREIDFTSSGELLNTEEKKSRKKLLEIIEEKGYDEVIEEVAYTWFNRFIALRFMEVNGYLKDGMRIFTSIKGEFEPQILTEAINIEIEGLNREKVFELYNHGNKEEELYKYLLITKCNSLNKILPGMFQKINDYTELLLPDNLLRENSIIDKMVREIPEEDWKEQVQIIGWLYQFYNTEPKAEIFARPKSNKIQKEEIPAATQLFTPDWIVRYMVENSLGRLWINGHPNEELKSKWRYYLEEAEQEKEVQDKLNEINEEYKDISPDEIMCLEPCIGSGHIGAYLFDVLIQIYESYGYKRRDAVKSIIEKNIYGFDIDERARQLAYFSIMMKAREYDKRFFERNITPQPKIYKIIGSNFLDSQTGTEIIEYFANGDENLKRDIISIVDDMRDGEEIGSALIIRDVNYDAIYKRFVEIESQEINMLSNKVIETLLPLVNQGKLLSQKYDVVVTNPPYMGSSRMNGKLSNYLKKNYKDSKSDLFAVFIEKCRELSGKNRFQAMITQHAWMFLSSYEDLRAKIEDIDIISMAHLGPRAFEEIGGEVVQATSFVIRNSKIDNYKAIYKRLVDGNSQDEKEELFFNKDNIYESKQENFEKIPGMPVAYWASDAIINAFEENKTIEDFSTVRNGMKTGKNERFLRFWWEVSNLKFNSEISNYLETENEKAKWFPYNKGGTFKKWYGNNDYVVNWKNQGYEIFNLAKKEKRNVQDYPNEFKFKPSITWSLVTSGKPAFRYKINNLSDIAGMSVFTEEKYLRIFLGLLNSKVVLKILNLIAPTINFQSGDISRVPIEDKIVNNNLIINIVNNSIEISKKDWDMHETSWDFLSSPLVSNKVDGKIESAYESYKSEVNLRFNNLKENEEELNKIFIEIYGLEDELTPNVSDRDITVAKIFDTKDDIDDEIKGNRYVMTREDVVKNFLSYFIGCLMGRYSLDEDGLAFAGGDFDINKYQSFNADSDGIVIFTEDEYFNDDIADVFADFVKVIFGDEHLDENLAFIASELKGKSSDTSKDRIRKYFLNDFYKDHVKMYQKRPIYWQYDSGKAAAARGIFYLHRYDHNTFAKIRIDYIFEIQNRYKQELSRLEELVKTASKSDAIQYNKEINLLKKKITESEKFEEKIQHIADQYIDIDLDDGVIENYKLFKDVLTKIK